MKITAAILCLLALQAPARAQSDPPPSDHAAASPPTDMADNEPRNERDDSSGSQAASAGPTPDEGVAPVPLAEDGASLGERDSAGQHDSVSETDEAAAAAVALARQRSGELAPVEEEARGNCSTPRQAWLQLLYWLPPEGRASPHYNPAKAAACFETKGLRRGEAAKLARKLKQVLDKNPTWVAVDDIPTDPHYVDESGLPRYQDPSVAADYDDIVLIKRGGRWLFSAATLRRVPLLYPALAGWVERHLPPSLARTAFGIELWKYLAVLALAILAFSLQKLTVFVIRHYLHRLVRRTNLRYLDQAVDRADRPIGGLVMALVFYLGFPMLLFPARLAEIAMIATGALAAYSAVWLSYRLIDVLKDYMATRAAASESKLDDQLVPMVSKTLKIFVSVIGGIFILQNLHINVGSLLAGLGLGGLAFALAAKDTIANFFGSLMIFIDKPFQIGDWVVIEGTEGIVEEVGFRTTRVRTFYNSLVTVPNATITNSMVDNYGLRKFRRYSTTLSLTYDTPPDKIEAFCEGIRAVIAAHPKMRQDYYVVEFKEYGPSSLDILVYCFTTATSYGEEMRVRTELNLDILRLAHELGVSFAFPTQTLHVQSMVRPGESQPSHRGPTERAALAQIVDGFGPKGRLNRPQGLAITQGYDCGTVHVPPESDPRANR